MEKRKEFEKAVSEWTKRLNEKQASIDSGLAELETFAVRLIDATPEERQRLAADRQLLANEINLQQDELAEFGKRLRASRQALADYDANEARKVAEAAAKEAHRTKEALIAAQIERRLFYNNGGRHAYDDESAKNILRVETELARCKAENAIAARRAGAAGVEYKRLRATAENG